MANRIRKINIGTRDTKHIVALTALNASDSRAMDVGPDGTLYVADAGHHQIVKVFESGRIRGAVVGSTSTSGNINADGIVKDGNDARTNTPHSICVDKSGNIYVGDGTVGYQIRRMSSHGRIVLFAGNAAFAGDIVGNTGSDARFTPTAAGMGICVDAAGQVYIADSGNHKIKKIWESGKITTLAGNHTGFANGTGTSALFAAPADCCVDNHSNIYVADTSNNRIRKITESGVVTTLAGGSSSGSTDGNAYAAKFNAPVRVCIDPSNQFLYVLDSGNSAIRRVTMNGVVNTFCHYSPPTSSHGDICVDNSGFLYILEKDFQ